SRSTGSRAASVGRPDSRVASGCAGTRRGRGPGVSGRVAGTTTGRPEVPAGRDEWPAVDALGHAVDDELAGLGVSLTVGGEPTFVAAEGADRPEWTLAPDGPDKRQRAERLLLGLRDRLAPGA